MCLSHCNRFCYYWQSNANNKHLISLIHWAKHFNFLIVLMPLWPFLPFLRALTCLPLKCGSHGILFSAHRSFYHQDHLVWLQCTTMAICGGHTPYRPLFDLICHYGLNYLVSTCYSYVSRSCPGIYLAFRCIYPDVCWTFIARYPIDNLSLNITPNTFHLLS